MVVGLYKEEIDTIEDAIVKFGNPYFGSKEERYSATITDNGKIQVNVDKLFLHTSPECWNEIKTVLKGTDLKAQIESEKVAYGELTKKPDEERIYKETINEGK